MAKPGIPKGTRDFSPIEVSKRQYIIQIIKTNFERYGYQPIETPSFENSETLMGKYGEEGDRLIFKILNSGDYFPQFRELIKSYFTVVYSEIFRNLFNEYREGISNNIEDFNNHVKVLLSKNFVQHIVDFVNERNPEYKFTNFHSQYLIAEVRTEFLQIRKSEFAKKKFKEILQECIECDPMENNKTKSLLRIFIDNTSARWMMSIDTKDLNKQISEKALRYDLTVPFARYVVQHQNEIEFPFKRYQIQPVWRADRPQKGRFREFYQCDADVVGSTSLWQEVELVQLYDAVFTELGLEGVTIKINNRKVLSGIAEVIGASDKLIDFTVALDKLDKIGEEGVKKEMLAKGISPEAIEKVQPLFQFTGTIAEKIEKLSELLQSSEEGKKGVAELQFICDTVTKLGLKKSNLDLDVTLARGLNYYTGAIFEVAAPKTVAMGSIGGGGRYDDLTGIFGLKNVSGVGISFGLDRIYLVLEELGLFPQTVTATSKAIFFNYGETEAFYAMQAITRLRNEGIKVELYPDKAKLDKQFKYAEKRQISFAVMAGSNEIATGSYSVKDLITGEKHTLDFEGLKKMLQ
ncbi:histidine--tRNA ligase [uncultured Flavobacterium sp.]|uniref:histidine--tRNA ligase n=1 Tax=uncultured Flavobacterium sp. TaxID=165435 RepID=UPI001223C3C4|nr:histidine--tRNA ligase [uncultured Flavobacterium sp.]THD31282.1 MAG: histidine--tRNA ligase [Flavobacterium johnsoniae]